MEVCTLVNRFDELVEARAMDVNPLLSNSGIAVNCCEMVSCKGV